jgi:hypothetical protein
VGRVFFELAAQAGHVEPQVVSALMEAGTPYAIQQLRRANELAGALQKHSVAITTSGAVAVSAQQLTFGHGAMIAPAAVTMR